MAITLSNQWVGKVDPKLTGLPRVPGALRETPSPNNTASPTRYQTLWAELHRRALLDPGPDQAWLKDFARRLPCGDCRRDWFRMIAATPPDWANYFRWTVDRHNEINIRLRKPVLSEAQARGIWA